MEREQHSFFPLMAQIVAFEASNLQRGASLTCLLSHLTQCEQLSELTCAFSVRTMTHVQLSSDV